MVSTRTRCAELLNQSQLEEAPYDFTIECADGTRHAHRNVLAAKSDCFKALFDIPMVEASSLEVILRDICKETMTRILDIIYTHVDDFNADNNLDLFKTAHYLQVTRIMTKCIKANISTDNVTQMYCTAGKYCMRDLCEFVFGVLEKNTTPLITTDFFSDMVDADLIRAFLESDNFLVLHEDSVFEFLTAWLDKKQVARMWYAGECKELIRFPFLKAETVEQLEKVLAPSDCGSKAKISTTKMESGSTRLSTSQIDSGSLSLLVVKKRSRSARRTYGPLSANQC